MIEKAVKTLSEENLLIQARAGDERAWRVLYERDKEMIYRMAYRVLLNREEALDVVQETFCKAFSKLDQLSDNDAWGKWIRRIAFNASISRTRTTGRIFKWFGKKLEEEDIPKIGVPQLSVRENAEYSELSNALRKALSKLSPKQRAIATLHFEENLSGPEISGILNISHNTVRSHLFRARQHLQKHLEKFLSQGER